MRKLMGTLLACVMLLFCASPTHALNSGSSDFNIEIHPMISMSLLKDYVDLRIEPNINESFAMDTLGIEVTTNNRTGYTLFMALASDESSLVQRGTVKEITNLAKSVTVTDTFHDRFTMNSWGYNLGGAFGVGRTNTFYPMPLAGDPITLDFYDSPASKHHTDVNFAARADATLPSGNYTNTILITAIPNYISTIDDFFHITYLQEMTPAICETATIPEANAITMDRDGSHAGNPMYVPTVKLMDNRDNAMYSVSRLPDGNCWMTQNMRLASTTERDLDSTNSDLPAGKTFKLPRAQQEVGIRWANDIYDSINLEKGHAYHIASASGNLYNWYAATAGTAGLGTSANNNAAGSICPRGWQIPPAEGDKSYTNLIRNAMKFYDDTEKTITSANNYLELEPFVAIPTGYYYYEGQINEPNSHVYLTKTAKSSTAIYLFNISSTYLNTKDDGYKVNGYSVRCVSK